MRKNFLFYVGHLFLLAWFITLAQGRTGTIHLLAVTAVLFYIIALLRAGSHYREEIHGFPDQLKDDHVCVGFGKFVKGEALNPYIFVVSNPYSYVKKIVLDPYDESEIAEQPAFEGITNGTPFGGIKAMMAGLQNNSKNYHQIEIFADSAQLGLPVSYISHDPIHGQTTGGLLKDESTGFNYKGYYCNISLKKGNSLEFMMLPNSHMVVHLHPYRQIE